MYALRTPFFELTDEMWHFRRIQSTFGNALPPGLAFVDEAPTAPQADHQPPLYYVLGAMLVAPLDIESDPVVYRQNSYALPYEPGATGNRNVLIPLTPPQADGPLSRAILRLRFLSIASAAGVLVLTYLAYIRLTRRNTLTSLAALVALALLPGYMVVGSGVSNIAPGLLLLVAAGYLALRMVDDPEPSLRLRWVAALVASLAALTSWWGWGAVLIVGFALIRVAHGIGKHTLDATRDVARQLAVAGAPALGWLAWLVLNGEQAAVDGAEGLESAGIAQVALTAYRGLFGWLTVPADPIYYTTVSVLLVMSLSGLGLWAIRVRWRRPSASWRARVRLTEAHIPIMALWVAVGVFFFGAPFLTPAAVPSGAALLPLAPAITLILVCGLQAWIRRRFAPVLLGLLVLAFGAVSITAPVAYVGPAYAGPPRLDLYELPYDMAPLDVAFGDALFLLGYRVDESRLAPGGAVEIELFWLGRRQMDTDYVMHLTVLGYELSPVASHMAFVGGGVHPSSLWMPGDVVIDRLRLRIADETRAPTAAEVRVSIYADTQDEPLKGMDPHGNELGGNIRITQVRIPPRSRVRFVPEHPMDVNLDNEVSLVGYGLSPRLPVEGRDWQIVLYWRSEGPLFRDYTVFVHLVDGQGELVAQVDGRPLKGNYPTSFWTTGEHLRDVHYIPIPDHLPADEYRLRVGLYELATGERLTLLDSDPALDYVAIGPINVH